MSLYICNLDWYSDCESPCFCSFQTSIWVCFVMWLLITGIGLYNLWGMGALPCFPQQKPKSQNVSAENPAENNKMEKF